MTIEVIVMNIREDLLDDIRFFVEQARSHPVDRPGQTVLHKRYLRAALMFLFAYTEGVVNGWLRSNPEEKQADPRFKRIKFLCLNKKIDYLNEVWAARVKNPDVSDAKNLRNLFAHFAPGKDTEVFEKLTLGLVENAAAELGRWMNEMESVLGLERHPDNDEIMRKFAEDGGIVLDVRQGGIE